MVQHQLVIPQHHWVIPQYYLAIPQHHWVVGNSISAPFGPIRFAWLQATDRASHLATTSCNLASQSQKHLYASERLPTF